MRQIILLFGVLLGVLLAPCFGQESTTYYFLGNVFSRGATEGAELRQPYLVVTMAKESAPEDIIAVGMTNGLGELSFRGVPIDIFQPYVFSFDLLSGKHTYLRKGFKSQPSFKGGNINIHMKLDSIEQTVDLQTVVPKSEDASKLALDIAVEALPGAKREGANISSAEGLNYKIFVSGYPVVSEESASALLQVIGEYVERIVIAHPKTPNDYYAGAIDIFVQGMPASKMKPSFNKLEKVEGK